MFITPNYNYYTIIRRARHSGADLKIYSAMLQEVFAQTSDGDWKNGLILLVQGDGASAMAKVHFQGAEALHDEWIPMNSKRLQLIVNLLVDNDDSSPQQAGLDESTSKQV